MQDEATEHPKLQPKQLKHKRREKNTTMTITSILPRKHVPRHEIENDTAQNFQLWVAWWLTYDIEVVLASASGNWRCRFCNLWLSTQAPLIESMFVTCPGATKTSRRTGNCAHKDIFYPKNHIFAIAQQTFLQADLCQILAREFGKIRVTCGLWFFFFPRAFFSA
jgi:hypothetical protein